MLIGSRLKTKPSVTDLSSQRVLSSAPPTETAYPLPVASEGPRERDADSDSDWRISAITSSRSRKLYGLRFGVCVTT